MPLCKSDTAGSYLARQIMGAPRTRRATVLVGNFAGERGDVRQSNHDKIWIEIEEEVHCFPRSWAS